MYKKSYKISLLFGLSLINDYLTIFINNKDVFFEIQFNDILIKQLRPEYPDEYFLFLREYILESVSTMTNVTIDNGTDFAIIIPHILCQDIGVEYNSMKLFNSSNIDSSMNYDNYIVINTKVITGKDNDIYNIWNNLIKDKLVGLLNDYNINILIIGEKTYSDCYEYRIHNTFSIYDDLNFNKLIDLTVDNTVDLYTKNIINRNTSILKNSIFNIHIGEGGGIKIFGSTNNLIAFSTVKIDLFDYVDSAYYTDITYIPDVFIKLIENKLQLYKKDY